MPQLSSTVLTDVESYLGVSKIFFEIDQLSNSGVLWPVVLTHGFFSEEVQVAVTMTCFVAEDYLVRIIDWGWESVVVMVSVHFEVGLDTCDFSFSSFVSVPCFLFHAWNRPTVVGISFDFSFPLSESSLVSFPR